jgi:acyl phosphate:glycerol-3-phosphate acyltransferase
MAIILIILAVVLGYLIGSIPFGWVVIKLLKGQDIRTFGSGRTGGTNAWRAGGAFAGILTTLLDVFKVTGSVYLAGFITGGDPWAIALTGVSATLGHNYSFFLMKRVPGEDGKLHFQFDGGAGGSSAVGAAFGIWPASLLFILPVSLILWFIVGYASVATFSVGIMAIVAFSINAIFWGGPPEYIVFGILTSILQIIALQPNFKRLREGTEKVVSFSVRGRMQKKKAQEAEKISGNVS